MLLPLPIPNMPLKFGRMRDGALKIFPIDGQ
jgi:hypothetical protein